MVWFKVDDSFYDHPKAEELSDSAVALWTRAGSYCAKHLTDGFISHRKADRMCDNPATAITELLDTGLWEKDADGYRFHDWHDYQPTREEALAASKAKSVGGAVGNHRRWHVERGKADPQCPYCKAEHRSTDRITDQSTESPPNRPTRPDPTYIQPPSEVAADGLFAESAAPRRTSRRSPDAKERTSDSPFHAGMVVAAFHEGAKERNRTVSPDITKQVGAQAKKLIADGSVPQDQLLNAAREMGRQGWKDLNMQLLRGSDQGGFTAKKVNTSEPGSHTAAWERRRAAHAQQQ